MEHYEKMTESTRIYEGKILNLRRDTVELENGDKATREVIEHPGGVSILALDEHDNILMVRQFRYPTEKCIWEIPAGKRSPGEDPKECGMRELEEETGFTANSFELLGTLYPTPAYCTEVIYIYLAKDLVPSAQKLDEDEFLTVQPMSVEKVKDMILSGEITDAKTQIAVLKYLVLKNK